MGCLIYEASLFYIFRKELDMHPIWKDFYVDLGSLNDSEVFRILCDEEVIYTGKAHRKPGTDSILVRINDICADYLSHNWESAEIPTFHVQRAYVKIGEGLEWLTAASVQFANDWSYEEHDLASGSSAPVNGVVDIRQPLMWTDFTKTIVEVAVTLADGKTFTKYIPMSSLADFNADFNFDFSKTAGKASSTALVDLSQLGDVVAARIGTTSFKVVNRCNRYALYYVNAFGGWDSLLIEGNHSETDSLVRHERAVEYDNTSSANRGRVNYVNEIQKRLTLHTSWLLGDEASRMHHLLNATEVYLYDLEKRQMQPVVLTNTITEHKTYKGNGGQLVNYAIEVAFANERIRR